MCSSDLKSSANQLWTAQNKNIIYPQHTVHQEHVPAGMRQQCMYIQLEVRGPMLPQRAFKVKDIDSKLYWLINEMIDMRESGQEDLLLLQAYAQAMFLNIKKNILRSHKQGDLVEQAIEYFKQHYHEEVSIEQLAQRLYISPAYLSRLFKRKLNSSPSQCLIEIRIKEAKRLLIQTTLCVQDIAGAVGISDSKYFSRLFKKVEGITPVEYRRKSQNSPLL